jgi:hypothetical protein
MKTTLSIFTVIGMAIFFIACTHQPLTTTEVVILKDVTDKSLSQPNANEVLSLYGQEKASSGRIFRFSYISDVSYNKTLEAKLEAESEWSSNEFERKNKIKQFQNTVADMLTDSIKETPGKNYSSIYIPIANNLYILSQSKSTKRVLIVFSDLMENTANLSFYRQKDFSLLKSKPEQIQKQFESQATVSSLTGIEIYFVYQPSDPISDERFQAVSKFYKKLLEDKGAKVTISANLNI